MDFKYKNTKVNELYYKNERVNKLYYKKTLVYVSRCVVTISSRNCKATYISTDSTATSGDPSGSVYDFGTTVYIFATLNDNPNAQYGYAAPKGWVWITGRTYRVTSLTLSDGENVVEANALYDLNYLTFRSQVANGTIKLSQNGTATISFDMEYSTDDGTTWNTYSIGDTLPISNIGDTIKFRGNNSAMGESYSIYKYFSTASGKQVSISGNIMSILDKTCSSLTISSNYCFYKLFNVNRSYAYFVSSPELPAINLSDCCYYDMFANCFLLKEAPTILPAIQLETRCYMLMFYGCDNMKKPPILPFTSTAEQSCAYMFEECDSLTYVPKLHARNMASLCYQRMFAKCTSLYVSDSQTTKIPYEWKIPYDGTVESKGSIQADMFMDCLGERSSDDFNPAVGTQSTFYTQNEPV